MTIGVLWDSPSLGRARSVTSALAPIVVAIAYYLACQAAFGIGTLTHQFAPFWPPNVVLLCALLLAPKRQWPLFIAATFPAHVLAEQGMAMPLLQLVAAFGCNVSLALLNALALGRLLRGPPWLSSLRNASLYILLVVIVIPGAVAIAAGFEPMLGEGKLQEYWVFWWRWYLANAVSGLTLTPLFLSVWGEGRRGVLMSSRWRLFEGLALLLALIATCGLAFDTQLTRATFDLFPAILYLPIPVVLALSVRFGAKGASGAILLVTITILFGAMHGQGPFVGAQPDQNVVSFQLFIAIVAIPMLLLAALVEELRGANDRLSSVLDGISDCYYTLDWNGQITAANAKAAAWWGASKPGELVGKNYWEVSPDRRKKAWMSRTLEDGIATRGEFHTADGHWLELHAYPSLSGLSVFQHDITERRAAEIAVRRTQELLQSSLDALTSQIGILDRTGRIVAVNAAWRRGAKVMSEGQGSFVVGTNYLEECECARPHQRKIAAGLRKLIRDEEGEFRFEYASDSVDDKWFELHVTCFGKGAALQLVIANDDVSEVKISEKALRRLTGKFLVSQDEERRRIARELHDSTAQNLLAAALGIGQVLRTVPRLKRNAKAALGESRTMIEEAQRELRTVSYLLHPPMLDEAGLPAAMRWFCDGFAKRTEITVELDVAADMGRLPADIEATLFRVAQEALTNVHRHSGATWVRVSLTGGTPSEGGPDVVLAIKDNGQGMPKFILQPSKSRTGSGNIKTMGVGLAGMCERLHQLGGRLEILTGPEGTTVWAAVPLLGKITERIKFAQGEPAPPEPDS